MVGPPALNITRKKLSMCRKVIWALTWNKIWADIIFQTSVYKATLEGYGLCRYRCLTPILFIIVTQAKSDGESRKTDIFPGLPRYGQATTCGQGNLGAASGSNPLLKKRPPTWREVFRPPEMSSVNFRIRKKSLQPRTYLWKIFCI